MVPKISPDGPRRPEPSQPVATPRRRGLLRLVGLRRPERGAALVEFALVLPILMALALGVFTGGLAYSQQISLNGSAREASRFGATLPETQCSPASQCSGMTWAQLVRAHAVNNSGGTLTNSQVCVALVQGSGAAPSPVNSSMTTSGGACFADSSSDTGKRVQVRVTRPARLQMVFFTRTVNLTSRAVTRYEQ
jgi:Flp pilus assembly protein TadG